MTFDEALKEMKKGCKVKHQYFTSDEFFEWNGHTIICENGYDMAKWFRNEPWQNDGWSVTGESK